MAEQAGGVALVATLDYGPALAALREFQKAVVDVENSGAQISKMQNDLLRVNERLQENQDNTMRVNARLQENVAAQQAAAAEMEVLIQKTNQLTSAQGKEADEADKANRAQANAMRAQIKDAEYLNKTLEQRQQILARISASLKGQDVSELQPKQAEVLAARYGQLAVTEYAGGGLAQASLAQQQIAAREEQLAAEKAAEKELSAAHAEALKVNAALDQKAAVDRVANLETIRRLEQALAQQQIADEVARNEAILALRQAQEAELTALHAEALRVNRALDAEATAAAKLEAADRLANAKQIQLLETQLEADRVARAKLSNDLILEQRAAEEAEMTALHARALAENAAIDAAAAAVRRAEADAEASRMAEQAAEQISMVRAQADARKVADAERMAAIAAENAMLKEQAALEASRTADLVRSAKYEAASAGEKLKTLRSIQLAEQASIGAGTGGLSQNANLASSFPSSAVRDFNAIGSDFSNIHTLEAALKGVGEGAKSAKFEVKATAQEARELTTIIKDIITGEWARFGGSLTRLLTISGTFDGLLGVVGLSLLGATAAIAGMTAAAIAGAREQNALNLALAETGNYAGTTTSGLEETAETAAHFAGTIGNAKEVVLQLAESGRYSAEQIAKIAEAAQYVQEAGGNVEQFLKQVSSLKDNPTEAVYKLNEQFHFLTAGTYEAIAAAERHGDAIKASQLALDDFSSAMEERTKSVVENQGYIISGWNEIKKVISETIDALESLGRKQAPAQKLAELQTANREDLARLSTEPSGHRDVGGGSSLVPGQFGSGNKAIQERIDARNKEIALLQDQMGLETRQARIEGDRAQQTQLQVQAMRLYDTEYKRVRSPADKRKDEEEKLRLGLQPLVDAGIKSQADVDELVAKANAKYHDRKTPRGHIDPTDYNAAQERAKLDKDNLKVAQDMLALRKSLGLAITEDNYDYVEQLQLIAEATDYESRRQKILKEIANARRNGNENSRKQLEDELTLLKKQHGEQLTKIQLDYDAAEVVRDMHRVLLNIQTIEGARTTILQAQDALYGNAASSQNDILTSLAEGATIQKAQYDQAVQMVALGDSRASQEEIAYARQANTLTLAKQLFDIEQQRQKLLMDNAFSLQNVYQQTLNAVDAQISALEKSRTTLADQAVTGFSSGLGKANDSLFQSFKEKKTADAYTLQNFTGNIGGGIYDSITQSLSKELTESTLKGFQGLLKATGAVSIADAAREKAQQDLALNTASMTESLGVTIPDLLRKQLGYMDGTLTPTGPVGNAAVSGGHGALSQADQNAQNGVIGQADFTRATGKPSDISNATSALQTFGKESDSTLSQFGLTASSAASLLYTGVVAATSGSSKAIKNYVIYATAQLLELYAIQKLVGLIGAAAGGAGAAAGAGVQVGAVATPTVTSTPLYADGVASVDKDGYITAPGGPRDDRGLAWLSNGESVLTAAATKYYGADRIARMNKMQLPRFADGRVGAGAGSGAAGGGNVYIDMNFASGGGTDGKAGVSDAAQNGQMARDLESAVLKVISKYSQPGGAVYTTIRQIAGRP
jgi:phage-related minor tail protein